MLRHFSTRLIFNEEFESLTYLTFLIKDTTRLSVVGSDGAGVNKSKSSNGFAALINEYIK